LFTQVTLFHTQTFLDSEPEKRGILSRCISALVVISERSVAAHFFRTAITKLLKVGG
jgi:hypothetical protein